LSSTWATAQEEEEEEEEEDACKGSMGRNGRGSEREGRADTPKNAAQKNGTAIVCAHCKCCCTMFSHVWHGMAYTHVFHHVFHDEFARVVCRVH